MACRLAMDVSSSIDADEEPDAQRSGPRRHRKSTQRGRCAHCDRSSDKPQQGAACLFQTVDIAGDKPNNQSFESGLTAPAVPEVFFRQPDTPIRLHVFEWSRPINQTIIVPWTEIMDTAVLTQIRHLLQGHERGVAPHLRRRWLSQCSPDFTIWNSIPMLKTHT